MRQKCFLAVSLSILAPAMLTLGACQNESGSNAATAPDTHVSYVTNAPGPGKLTPEIINRGGGLNGPSLKRPAISPDGTMVTVLQGQKDNTAQQDLWAYDLTTGQGRLLVSSIDLLGAPEILSAEEKNRRERAREYGSGIVSYSWVGENQLLFPLGGDIYLYDLERKKSQRVTATPGFETDAKVSPSRNYVSYVRANNLFVKDLKRNTETQLTFDASEVIRNATASFVVQEELKRSTGYWWSPNESYLAFTQIDESDIAIENRIEFGADGIENVSQRYPFAGTKNASVKLGLADRISGEKIWADIGPDPDIYISRVRWSRNSQTLYVGILSRDHKTHKILAVNPNDGSSSVFFEETSPTWINVGTDFKALQDGSLLWSSEMNGKRQIYKISSTGKAVPITPENVLVNGLNCTDEQGETLYFTGWDETPLERHIFKIDLTGENLTKLSTGAGRHSARFARNCSRYIGTFSSSDTPPQTRAFDSEGAPLAWLNENALSGQHPYAPFKAAHIMPEFGKINAADGTALDYAIYKPADLKPGEKRPSITLVYGGPLAQTVQKGWQRHFGQMLAHHGFVVFQLDNRGAGNRGKAFEDHLYRSMGQLEVIDQTAGANWLKSQAFIDPDKMGVYGWSYGGYMVLHMLAQTDLYASGVSGAPVTDWALYDTAYTERYLGDPNPGSKNYTKGAYENGSVFTHLDGLTEPFLLIHGMADDNVVFRHSIKLMGEIQKSGQQNMRVMTYPGEKHGFRNPDNKVHRDRQILEFFIETLGGE